MNSTDLEAGAAQVLDSAAYAYIARGAGDGDTLEANEAAWRQLPLRPRVLRNMGTVDPTVTVLDRSLPTPVMVAPTAMHQFADAEGELATARGAERAGATMVLSMAATRSVEEVAAAAPGLDRWIQLYLLRDRSRSRDLIERAAASGYRAIVVSADGAAVPYGRARLGDAISFPATFRFPNLAPGTDDGQELMALVNDYDPAVTDDDLAEIASWTNLPVVVKGVLRADDAARSIDAGAAAIIVSNHGGRIIDGTIATADALSEVVEAVDGRAQIYVDGGIRTGADVVRALALGADAALVGRPVLWGLALGGAEGVAGVLTRLTAEVVRAMAFCGAASTAELTPDLVGR